MRNRILIVLFILPFTGFGQRYPGDYISENRTRHYLDLFLKPDRAESTSTESIYSFIDKLENRRSSFKKDEDFLRYVFTKTHQKFLRRYTDYCTFSVLLDKGVYNCLTGTALYALMLDRLNINYRIIETNYHIFLLIEMSEGRILLEATDAVSGFVNSPKEIDARIERYKNIVPVVANKMCYRYNADIYNTVNLEQLVGLMYYNLSVSAYNNKLLSTSIEYLEQSVRFYKTQRTEEFSRIIFLTLSEYSNDADKEVCLQKLQLLNKKSFLWASNAGLN